VLPGSVKVPAKTKLAKATEKITKAARGWNRLLNGMTIALVIQGELHEFSKVQPGDELSNSVSEHDFHMRLQCPYLPCLVRSPAVNFRALTSLNALDFL